MNDLPSLYAAVCAKRPELAVDASTVVGTSLFWHGEIDEDGNARDPRDMGWFVSDDGFEAMLCGGPDAPIAAALILARWVEALPVGMAVRHHAAFKDFPDEWSVSSLSMFSKDNRTGPTPLEALAAYYLGETA